VGRGVKQEAWSKNTRSSRQSGSSSDTSNVEIAFVTPDLVQRARSEKQEQFRRSQSLHFLIPPSLFAFYLLYSMSDSITHSKRYSSDVIGGIDPVTINSSICSDSNHNDYEEAFSEESPSKKRKAYNKNNVETSWILSHFKKMEEKKEFAFCDLCMKEVYYSKYYSISMLICHMETTLGHIQTSSWSQSGRKTCRGR